MKLLLSVCIFLTLSYANSLKILVVYPIPGTSHYILGNAVARTLVEAGHDVHFISPFKEKNKPKNAGKWTDVFLEGAFEESREEGGVFSQLYGLESMNPVFNLPFMNYFGSMMADKTLNHSAVQNLLKSNEKFDLVIIEQFTNDAYKGFAWHYKAPMILVSSIAAGPWINPLTGNPGPIAYIPDIYLSYSEHMTFFQRVKNTLMYILSELNRNFILYPIERDMLKKYFPEAPPLDDLLYNASLVFLNSHISTSPAKPHVPALQEIGGFHINPPKKLPEDLQTFLDNAKEGAVYFSMGSNLKSADLPVEKRNQILKSLSKLKQKVLWKFEDENLPGKPDNVKIMKWCPQQDILAHPNVKAFITHGGLLSSTETIYHGVPVLCIPIFGDQKINAAQYAQNGFGVSLPYQELNEQTFTESLNEVLNNPKYTKNVKRRSKVFHDRQVTPKENLVYWTEYVVRYQGAPHLRVAALDLAWYQYFLLDVFAFLSVIFIGSLTLTCLAIKCLCCSKKKALAKDKKLKTK